MKIIYRSVFFILVLLGLQFFPGVNSNVLADIVLKPVKFESLSGWSLDNHSQALKAFRYSCEKFNDIPNSNNIGGQLKKIQAIKMKKICSIGNNVNINDAFQTKDFFEKNFLAYEIYDEERGGRAGLFTGYYEPELNGSYIRTSRYKYPVYKKPSDLSGTSPYYTRKQIDQGIIDNRGLELLYVDDKIDLFFMHIQGSGKIKLDNGQVIKLSFSARNNVPYTSIGSEMIKLGLIDKDNVSADTIKEWLRNNPEKADDIMKKNESYVFFQISDKGEVIGAQGVPLTPERSLAVDTQSIPLGFPVWVETSLPSESDSEVGGTSYNRLFVAQDTGNAIKGSVRGDIFFGSGERAERLAYKMQQTGEYYILIPRERTADLEDRTNNRYKY
jgi:membrane-bound lytic murein transglycosylase A